MLVFGRRQLVVVTAVCTPYVPGASRDGPCTIRVPEPDGPSLPKRCPEDPVASATCCCVSMRVWRSAYLYAVVAVSKIVRMISPDVGGADLLKLRTDEGWLEEDRL
jgi:hypothetical protein